MGLIFRLLLYFIQIEKILLLICLLTQICFLFFLVLLCIFLVSCCNIHYNFHIKKMLGLFLTPVICRRAHVLLKLFYVCLCIVACFLFCLSSSYVLCTQCCQFLWIVHFLITPLVFSNIYKSRRKIKFL